ncbi:MAG TPA: lysylphosphatidylglycerol synthase domain-containing protein [Dehalococcoidia bacterium]|nr:lysylphosphatidylglycerol synthase domain-containing protein [Dehalococcoidia bacterium]
MRRGFPVAIHLITFVGFVFAAVPAAGRLDGLAVESAPWLALSFGCMIAQFGLLVVGWLFLLARFDAPRTWPFAPGVQAYVIGWLARYIPGPPIGTVGKYVMCRRNGVAGTAVAGALVYELLAHIGGGLVLLAVLAPFSVRGPEVIWATPVAGSILVGAMSLGVPAGLARVASLPGRAGSLVPLRRASHGVMLVELGCQVGSALCAALAFHFTAMATTPLSMDDAALTLFAFALAGYVGFIVPFVPSGAGVREGILIAFLAPELGGVNALSLAVVARALSVVFDAGLAAFALCAYAGLPRRPSAIRFRAPWMAAKSRA